MKRLLLPLLLLAVCGCGSTGHPQAPRDVAKILSTIVRHEARLPRERLPTCLSRRTRGVALDEQRESLREALEWPVRNSKEAKLKEDAVRSYSSARFSWRKPGTAVAYGFESGAPLSEPEGLGLSKAAATIVQAPPRPSTARIDWKSVPWRLQGWGWLGYCGSTLSLTAPAFHGDLAFVETSHVCGGLCGYGWIYALRRREDEWTIVAEAMTWVS